MRTVNISHTRRDEYVNKEILFDRDFHRQTRCSTQAGKLGYVDGDNERRFPCSWVSYQQFASLLKLDERIILPCSRKESLSDHNNQKTPPRSVKEITQYLLRIWKIQKLLSWRLDYVVA